MRRGAGLGGARTGTRMNWSDWWRANFLARFLMTTLPPALRLDAVTFSPAILNGTAGHAGSRIESGRTGDATPAPTPAPARRSVPCGVAPERGERPAAAAAPTSRRRVRSLPVPRAPPLPSVDAGSGQRGGGGGGGLGVAQQGVGGGCRTWSSPARTDAATSGLPDSLGHPGGVTEKIVCLSMNFGA